MNDDDRLLLDVRSWLKDEDVVPPDAEQAGRLVAAELPETRQLRRTRWSLPTLTRKNSSPTIDQTTAYQPSPIPATNGHTPTVIGRTQSMLSPVKAITAGALVFAIGGVLLIVQPFEQQGVVPGATISEPSEAVEFTATIPWGPEIAAGTSEGLASGVVEQVGWAHRTASASASDPRFDGDVVYTCNSHLYLDGQGRLFDCVFRVENAEGAWQSQPALQLDFGNASFGPFGVFTAVFDGEDGYEGLTAVVEVTEIERDGYNLHGLIVDGYLPPNAEHFEAE